jgi:ssRNA-specific RNase YbeY (16S rRNA maturation enzyme)
MNDMSEQTGRGGPKFTADKGVAPRWLVQALARRLRRAARRLGIGPQEQCGIAVHLVDDAAIARLNAEHMGKSGPTDVLSFPAGEAPEGAPEIGLGDVVISVDAVRRQARARLGLPTDAGTGAKRQVLWGVVVETGRKGQALPDMVAGTAEAEAAIDEATVLAVHGLCHLLGHDHGQPGEARRMLRSEQRGLRAARTPDVPRPYGRGPGRTA